MSLGTRIRGRCVDVLGERCELPKGHGGNHKAGERYWRFYEMPAWRTNLKAKDTTWAR